MSLSRIATESKPAAPRWATGSRRFAEYAALTKARLALLVLFTTLIGYLLGADGAVAWPRLAWTIIGTGLTALAASALNQWLEISADGQMRRTCARPLPTGALSPRHALVLASGMVFLGLVLLASAVSLLSALLAATTVIIYLAAYTPLKTRTSLCTLLGAICGAIPPLIGWAAATGRIDAPALVLATILMIWQIPHSLALAWRHRQDCARAGFRLLPALDVSGNLTALLTVLYSLALIPVTLSAVLVGLAGYLYAAVAAVLGVGLVVLAMHFGRRRTDAAARRLFLAGLAYLPLLFGVMLADHCAAGALSRSVRSAPAYQVRKISTNITSQTTSRKCQYMAT
jgi:heme o synthase